MATASGLLGAGGRRAGRRPRVGAVLGIAFTILSGLGGLLLPVAHAGGYANPEMGSRRTAMGAVVGRPDDLSAVYHNPAGLTLGSGTRLFLSMGVVVMNTDLRLRPWADSERFIDAPVDSAGYYPEISPRHNVAPVPMLVAATSLFSEKLSVALSAYVPNAAGAFFDEDEVSRYHLVDAYIVSGVGGITAAYAPWPWLSVGAGFSLVYVRLDARRKLFPIVNGEDLSSFLGSQTDLSVKGSDLVPGWNFGVLVWPHRTVSIGAAVISRTTLNLEGDVKAELGEDGIGDLFMEGRQRTGLLLPWTLHLGVNWDLSRYVEVGTELRYFFYRELDEMRTEIEEIPLLEELVSPKNFSDSWQVAAGVRVHDLVVPRLEWMLGGHYDKTPAPNATVSLESPFFNHVALYTGGRYLIADRYQVGLSYIHYWYLERRVEDSITTPPSNFVGSAENHIVTLTLEVRLGKGIGY